jgi:hypothetical protein
MQCECCGSTEGVELESSRTAYDPGPMTRYQWLQLDDPLNGKQPDPNVPLQLCRDCAAEHHAQWDQAWQEFYNSRF